MHYQNVCLEAIAATLPDEVVTSEELERRLAPLYRRLRLPEGRLELMTGITERRFWARGTLPSEASAITAGKALLQAGVDRGQVGAVVHGSVCRDYLEPATACAVHQRLGLPADCLIYDVSNACLGLLTGMVQVANMIELGQIQAGVVVGTENGRTLVESTVRRLNEDATLTRNDIKRAVASLTIGSGSAAVVLVDRKLSRTGNRLLGGFARTKSEFCHLCRGGQQDSVGQDSELLMWTDSETLMHEGVRAAQESFGRFLDALDWTPDRIDKVFCHQVGRAHRKLLFKALNLAPDLDFSTLEFLGNTGSVALPITAALGIERGCLEKGDQVAFLGIGSGINVLMLGVDWQQSPIAENPPHLSPKATRGLAGA